MTPTRLTWNGAPYCRCSGRLAQGLQSAGNETQRHRLDAESCRLASLVKPHDLSRDSDRSFRSDQLWPANPSQATQPQQERMHISCQLSVQALFLCLRASRQCDLALQRR
jgi:hypothetical protein